MSACIAAHTLKTTSYATSYEQDQYRCDQGRMQHRSHGGVHPWWGAAPCGTMVGSSYLSCGVHLGVQLPVVKAGDDRVGPMRMTGRQEAGRVGLHGGWVQCG